jgi:hypothetical protein
MQKYAVYPSMMLKLLGFGGVSNHFYSTGDEFRNVVRNELCSSSQTTGREMLGFPERQAASRLRMGGLGSHAAHSCSPREWFQALLCSGKILIWGTGQPPSLPSRRGSTKLAEELLASARPPLKPHPGARISGLTRKSGKNSS